ncbi:hypothetical protein AB0F73_13665 [Micromonospora purpureochromogenes]|uniref:hypothetical protein n=1 Tax=Micromonospora purpureochromogenes TaxID=47872 RepID=UPI0033DF9366
MDFPMVVAWAESFAEDNSAPIGLRMFCAVLLNTEPVKAFIATRDTERDSE